MSPVAICVTPFADETVIPVIGASTVSMEVPTPRRPNCGLLLYQEAIGAVIL